MWKWWIEGKGKGKESSEGGRDTGSSSGAALGGCVLSALTRIAGIRGLRERRRLPSFPAGLEIGEGDMRDEFGGACRKGV